MIMISNIAKMALATILKKPATASAFVIFGLGFTLVASNAIYSQQAAHPDPIWTTQKDEESLTSVVGQPSSEVNHTGSITKSVLTQRISLQNIPVPTAKPGRSQHVASQTSLVRQVQASLAEIGYYTGKVDGIYGSGTKSAIKKFQKEVGLIPNGEVDYDLKQQLQVAKAARAIIPQQAQPKAEPVPEQQALEGSTPNSRIVAQIQFGLKENFGIENITVDGVMGAQTKNAVRAFQDRFGLEATGELDDDTLQKMKSVGILTSI